MRLDAERERLRHVPRAWDLPLVAAEAVILLVVVALIAAGVTVGWIVGHEAPSHTQTVTVTAPTR